MPCGTLSWPDSRFDAEEFIVAFFKQWAVEAAGLDNDFHFGPASSQETVRFARRDLFTTKLERALEFFDYEPGIARKFREIYIRWERAVRFQHDEIAKRIVSTPTEDAMSKPLPTLRQEVNRVMEIVEQIEALSPQSQAYLMALLYQHPASGEALPAGRRTLARAKRRMRSADESAPPTTEDLDEEAAQAHNVGTDHRQVVRACCGSRGRKHLKTCARTPA